MAVKFVFVCTARTPQPGADYEEWIASQRRVFERWLPEPALTIQHFLWRADGRGAFAVVDLLDGDLARLARSVAIFSPWFDYEIVPCIDIPEALSLATEASEFRGTTGE